MSLQITNTRGCRENLIDDFIDRILETGMPEHTHVTGREQPILPRRKFYATEALKLIFTIDNIKAILGHKCENCQKHLGPTSPAHPSQYSPGRILESDATLCLFALLVMLRYPLLVGIFLTAYDLTSIPQPRYFSLHDIKDRMSKYLTYKSAEQLAAAFQDHKWQFSVPSFHDGSFQNYEEGTILPFVDEEPIDRGSYGKVFKVWVHPQYCALDSVQVSSTAQRNPRTKLFARKEIVNEDAIEFIKEKINLERIATLKHPHLVQIQKTYQIGDKFNILFPCAKTNLHWYLREEKWQAPQHLLVSKNPLWQQVIGITRGLSKIINFTNPDEPDQLIFGYHLDLKPQNILVDSVAKDSIDVFKITDFGQARFLDVAFSETSRISGAGGTDAYAPPEYVQPEQDQTYDIWSLGIIILEILAFAIKGVDGLRNKETGIDYVRITEEAGHTNARFYTISNSIPKVKPVIMDWVEALLEDPMVEDEENQKFVRSVLDLIKLMLEPDMKKRVRICGVVDRMELILNKNQTETTDIFVGYLRQKDELVLVDLKRDIPHYTQNADYYPRGVKGRLSMRVPFLILENNNHRLRTWVGQPILPACDQRQEIKLILNFQHTTDLENDMFEISFASVRDDYAVSLQGQSIVVNERTIARKIQMALTGHYVSNRYRLAQMTYAVYRPHLKCNGDNNNSTLVPLWIELWMEKPQTAVLSTSTDSISSSKRQGNKLIPTIGHVPQGRVVIYCKEVILLLPFVRECHLAKQEDMKALKSQDITFEAMDKRQREYFTVSYISAEKDQLPGIPIYHAALREIEKSNTYRLKSLNLKFENPDEAYQFYRLYKNEKARWLDATKGKPFSNPSMVMAS